MNLRAARLLCFGCFVCLAATSLKAAPEAGKISGVVLDSGGTPQMGARVVILPEKAATFSPVNLLTNASGAFSSATLPTGLYSVEVTLAGFLPTIQQHIDVSDAHSTLLQLVLGSVFSTLGQLRQQDEHQGASDDWVWVLRTRGAVANRPVLRWGNDNDSIAALAASLDTPAREEDHGLVELSSGGDRPISVSTTPVAPGTAFAYDVPLGLQGRFLMAGEFSYLNDMSTSGLAAEWLPTGNQTTGPVTTLVAKQSQFGRGGPTPVFRGMRISHDDQLAVGDRVSVRYGGEYIFAGFGTGTSALRPRAEVAVELSPAWQLAMIAASRPWDDALGETPDALQSAANSFDAFPVLMMRRGSPKFENGLHEEVAVKHSFGQRATLSTAVFHDKSTHTAVMGEGIVPAVDFVQGFFGSAFAYDGGHTASMGTRVVYEQKMGDGLTSTVLYDYSGALTAVDDGIASRHLRDSFTTQYRHSVSTRVSAKLPVVNTKVMASYKWLNAPVVSQQDPYGESTYGVAPYLSMGIRQPLPAIFPGHMVVQADVGNLLSQGGTPMTAVGKHVVLVPAYRYFRGGLSFQF